MADNDDYLDSIDNNHLEGTNGSLNMTDNSLGVSILFLSIKSWVNLKINYNPSWCSTSSSSPNQLHYIQNYLFLVLAGFFVNLIEL